jgi:putative DNA primase/helicase
MSSNLSENDNCTINGPASSINDRAHSNGSTDHTAAGSKPAEGPSANSGKKQRKKKPQPKFSRFEVNEFGLYRTDTSEDGNESNRWIGPRIFVVALTHNSNDEGYGHLVRFTNMNGRERMCILLYSELIGKGGIAIERLHDLGYKARDNKADLESLRRFLLEQNPSFTVSYMSTHGWHAGRFIHDEELDLTDQQMGDISILDPAVAAGHRYKVSGALKDWQGSVGRLCQRNTRLVLAISAAFAGPLLHLVRQPNIGIHLRGPSSIGKTTALHAAGSVWGGGDHGFIESWRATHNGLELQCALHNDAILPLDEISLVNAKELGDIVYALGNGIGKRRATRDIRSRPVVQFRLVFISSGERSLQEMMGTAGKSTKGGQESRLIDIPADTGTYGLFENLHDHHNGAALSKCLTQAAKQFYGTPSRAFIQHLTENPNAGAEARELQAHFVSKLKLPEHNAAGEVYRVAESLGLIAAAGEMATQHGVTGWDPEEHMPTWATAKCFEGWRAARGGYEAHDVHAGVAALAAFLSKYPARFQFVGLEDADTPTNIHERAGFWDHDAENECRQYYINRQVFQNEICRDYDYQAVLQWLNSHQLLVTNEGDRLTYRKMIRTEGFIRFYSVLSTICETL